jgi:hypothetical protein
MVGFLNVIQDFSPPDLSLGGNHAPALDHKKIATDTMLASLDNGDI